MKLHEIFDTTVSHRKANISYNSDHKEVMRRRQEAAQLKDSPAGKSGRIHFDSSDPKKVHKSTHGVVHLPRDGYYKYMSRIIERRIAQTNPFAPRAFSVRTVTDNDGNGRYKFSVEKLESVSSLSVKQLQSMTRSLFPKDYVDKAIQSAKEFASHTTLPTAIWIDTLHQAILDLFNNKINTLDSRFSDLIKIIKDLRNTDDRLRLDINRDNYMVRLDDKIPQIVITDPLG